MGRKFSLSTKKRHYPPQCHTVSHPISIPLSVLPSTFRAPTGAACPLYLDQVSPSVATNELVVSIPRSLVSTAVPQFSQEWEKSVESREGFSRSEKNKMLLSKETRDGLKFTGIQIWTIDLAFTKAPSPPPPPHTHLFF